MQPGFHRRRQTLDNKTEFAGLAAGRGDLENRMHSDGRWAERRFAQADFAFAIEVDGLDAFQLPADDCALARQNCPGAVG